MNLLVSDIYINFRGSNDGADIDTPQALPLYSINTTLLTEGYGGIVSGTLTKTDGYCNSGQWTISVMTGTNLFLVSIDNFSEDIDDVSLFFLFNALL